MYALIEGNKIIDMPPNIKFLFDGKLPPINSILTYIHRKQTSKLDFTTTKTEYRVLNYEFRIEFFENPEPETINKILIHVKTLTIAIL